MTFARGTAALVVAVCAASAGALAQTPAQLDSAFTSLADAAEIVGMSAAVVHDGALAWNGVFGVRDSSRPERVDRNTVFDAVSLRAGRRVRRPSAC